MKEKSAQNYRHRRLPKILRHIFFNDKKDKRGKVEKKSETRFLKFAYHLFSPFRALLLCSFTMTIIAIFEVFDSIL